MTSSVVLTDLDFMEKRYPRMGISLKNGMPLEDSTIFCFFNPPMIKVFLFIGRLMVRLILFPGAILGAPLEVKPMRLVFWMTASKRVSRRLTDALFTVMVKPKESDFSATETFPFPTGISFCMILFAICENNL